MCQHLVTLGFLFLGFQEAETNRLCRRLQLKDIIPIEMQRLTKYPLLLDNIAKYTGTGELRLSVRSVLRTDSLRPLSHDQRGGGHLPVTFSNTRSSPDR